MKKFHIYSTVFICFIISLPVFSQTEEELLKMMEQMKSLGDSIEIYQKQSDSESQKQEEAFRKLFENPQNKSSEENAQQQTFESVEYDFEVYSLPALKTEILKKLPKNAPTKDKLMGYLNKLLSEIESNKAYIKDVSTAKQQMVYLDNQLEYNNAPPLLLLKKSPYAAIALSIMLVEKTNYNTLHLNNLAALLNLTGNPERAIPILLYIKQLEPNSQMVNNNLGQAYFQLGDIDTASNYLQIVIKKDAFHIQANLTMGIISANRKIGKETEKFLINSLKGGYTDEAFELLTQLLPDANIEELVYDDVKLYEDNEMGYNQTYILGYAFEDHGPKADLNSKNQLLKDAFLNESYPNAFKNFDNRCVTYPRSVNDIGRFNGEKDAMVEAWQQWMELYSASLDSQMQNTVNQFMNQKQPEMTGSFVKKGQFMIKVYGKKFDKRMTEASIAFTDKLSNAMKVQQNLLMEVDNRCRPIEDALDKYNCYCSGNNDAYGTFLQTMSGPYTIYCDNVANLSMQYYNAMSYWSSVAYESNPMLKNTILQQAQLGYYAAMVSRFRLEFPLPCDITKLKKTERIDLAFKDSNCPIDIKIPFGVGALSLTCTSFSLEGGEGFKFGFERDFSARTTTVLFGPGAGIEGGIGGFEVSAMGFVTWNGSNNISDYGVRGSAEAFAGTAGPFKVGKIDAQVQVGMESGFSASTGGKFFEQNIYNYQF